MNRGALVVIALAAAAAGFYLVRRAGVSSNVLAFLALIRQVEAGGDDYFIIAGGDRFEDDSEHPFVLEPNRHKPIGTTASGAYQMVRKTWTLARDALGLTDFSPASQDAAAIWLLKHKVPGKHEMRLEGTGNYELVSAGRFDEAIAALRLEWEAFDRMVKGQYHVSMAQAREFLVAQGGALA